VIIRNEDIRELVAEEKDNFEGRKAYGKERGLCRVAACGGMTKIYV